MTGPAVVVLMGPTAAGKTRLAAELVARGPFDIVSVDSAMVYRGLDIGTGKPGPALLERAPHRLIDLRDPDERYSAAEFRCDATREIEFIHRQGRIPLLAGGTGLYFRALLRGLSPLPPASPTVRRRLQIDARALGWAALHRRLAALDPEAAARIHPNDPQRIQRALEVHALSGHPMSELQGRASPAPSAWSVRRLSLEPAERAVLHRDIEARFHDMLEAGLLEELAELRRCWRLSPELPSMRTVGYRQAWRHLEGEWDRETMIGRALAATRQLARRQLTWLRAEPGITRIDSQGPRVLGAALEALGELVR